MNCGLFSTARCENLPGRNRADALRERWAFGELASGLLRLLSPRDLWRVGIEGIDLLLLNKDSPGPYAYCLACEGIP